MQDLAGKPQTGAVMRINKFVKQLARNTVGATAVELGVLLALVAIAVLASVQAVGSANSAKWTDVADKWGDAA